LREGISPTKTRQSPTLYVDGQEFKRLIYAALKWLQHHQAAINKLNVYPVPDGDTGTNMVLTMQSGWDEIIESSEENVGRIAHQMAHGALMGARGNSGVILSQIWRGFARSLDGKDAYYAQDLADALLEAADTAYKGVVKPVEGTILTVSRAVADAAARTARDTDNLEFILEHITHAAREAVALTPSLLPVLREAGVVDAGGQGLYRILEGMLYQTKGDPILENLEELGEDVDVISTGLAPGQFGYGYDVQFLILGNEIDVLSVRQRITELGDCPLVVGDSETVKVHVHVPDPGVPISYGASIGSLRDVVVEDMQAQYQEFISDNEQHDASPTEAPAIGVVAVVQGDGLAKVFRSLGADAIIAGGQTMNPSTKNILDAIDSLAAEQVILLPNNSNVILAAEQARSLSTRPVAVIPSRFAPQGISALLALNHQAGLETNANAMNAALQDVLTGEVTTATRSASINGIRVEDGEIIGLLDGDLTVSGQEVTEVSRALLDKMNPDQGEIVTIYFGNSITRAEAEELAKSVQQNWPSLEVECVDGGQPYYHYILSVE
jgi:fatty acid kinase